MSKAAAKRKKTAAKTSAKTSALVPQPHGGALSPGNPGNKGGGLRKSAVVQAYREDFYASRPFVERVVNGDEKDTTAECPKCKTTFQIAGIRERLKAVEIQRSASGLEKMNVIRTADPEVKERMQRMVSHWQTTPLIPDDVREQFIRENSEIWGGRKA